MEKKSLQQHILKHVECVDFPETIIEQTIIKLKNEKQNKKANELISYMENLHNAEFIKKARAEKFLPICYLSRELIDYYTMEAIPCIVLHRFFYILRCEMEVNLSWYLSNPAKVFIVQPTTEMKAAENMLWDFLEKEPIKSSFKLHYRHLLNALFLFHDYLSKPELASTFLNKLEKAELKLY